MRALGVRLKGTCACAEHTHQELIDTLSIPRIRTVAEHTHQFLTRKLSIGVKITNLKRFLKNKQSIRERN
jgi:hypothetical protein